MYYRYRNKGTVVSHRGKRCICAFFQIEFQGVKRDVILIYNVFLHNLLNRTHSIARVNITIFFECLWVMK